MDVVRVHSEYMRLVVVQANDGSRGVFEGREARHYELRNTGDLEADCRASFTGCDVARPACPPGHFYPRILRPGPRPFTDAERRARDSSAHAARNLFRRLLDVFRFIEPCDENRFTFGHETRDLLVLACTEVESGCKAVLTANGYERRDDAGDVVDARRWNITRDYIHAATALRLAEWEVALLGGHFAPFRPFEAWTPAAAPPWYTAYNRVKHDRETLFSQATLEACIRACGAVFVMVCAQFGSFTLSTTGNDKIDVLQLVNASETSSLDAFRMTAEPAWLPADHYVEPALVGATDWTPTQWRW